MCPLLKAAAEDPADPAAPAAPAALSTPRPQDPAPAVAPLDLASASELCSEGARDLQNPEDH